MGSAEGRTGFWTRHVQATSQTTQISLATIQRVEAKFKFKTMSSIRYTEKEL